MVLSQANKEKQDKQDPTTLPLLRQFIQKIKDEKVEMLRNHPFFAF
jgi:hypothetical protein